MMVTDDMAEAAWRAFLETQRASLLKRAGGPTDWMRGAIEAALSQVRAAGDVKITDSMAETAWQVFLATQGASGRDYRQRQPVVWMRAALEAALASSPDPESLRGAIDALTKVMPPVSPLESLGEQK